MLTTPGAAISWKATKVEVAKSGDLAYVSGTYEETMTDASGKSVKDHGKYVEVWKKQDMEGRSRYLELRSSSDCTGAIGEKVTWLTSAFLTSDL
jgi:hypothetical protein